MWAIVPADGGETRQFTKVKAPWKTNDTICFNCNKKPGNFGDKTIDYLNYRKNQEHRGQLEKRELDSFGYKSKIIPVIS